MKIGILTGGGDAPGLNGIIESASRTLIAAGHEVIGIRDGFEGVFDNKWQIINVNDLLGLHSQSGTFLGTTNRTGTQGREDEFLSKFKDLGIDGLIVAGGDGTFGGLKAFEKKIPIIGVPKTIDNDLSGTEITFGYDTACSVVSEAVDSLRATALAHRRIIVVETMGRTAGWIALGGGLSSYADVILTPERPFNKEALIDFVIKRKKTGLRGLIIVVSEGAKAEDGKEFVERIVVGSPQAKRYGGISFHIANWIESETDWEARHVVLGHLQRSRPPTTTDRFLTLAMGVEAARMVSEKAWDQAVVYRNGRVQRCPISDLMKPARTIPQDHRWIKLAQALSIFI